AAGPRRLQLEKYMRVIPCDTCTQQRLNPQARAVRVGGRTLPELCALPIGDLAAWLAEPALNETTSAKGAMPTARRENEEAATARPRQALGVAPGAPLPEQL